MEKYIDYLRVTQIYAHVWSKYRPAILNLMTNSVNGPQRYSLSGHEFKIINPREKGGYSFTMQVFGGKAVNKIKTSPLAQDLLLVLQRSNRAMELTGASTFEFTLDKNFVFHVTRQKDRSAEVVESPLMDQQTAQT